LQFEIKNMYTPKYFSMPERDRQLAFMRANSFATIVTTQDGGLMASHVPVRANADEDGALTLRFHLAKPNPQVAQLRAGGEVLLIFHGPHAYISPSNYEKEESVPTWNYLAVHAYGIPAVVEDKAAKLAMLADLIGHYEAAFQMHWDALSDKYRDGMLEGIVGFDIAVTRVEGKAKLSQNRSETDQRNVAEWLSAHAHETPRAVGDLMKRRLAQ
jgi:transcriptional regulator